MVNADTHDAATRWRIGSRRLAWRQAAGAAAIVATLTGCSSLTSLTGGGSTPAPTASTAPPPTASATLPPASSNASFTSRVKSFFSGDSSNVTTAAAQTTPGAPAAPPIDCPGVDYRQGAATLAVNS